MWRAAACICVQQGRFQIQLREGAAGGVVVKATAIRRMRIVFEHNVGVVLEEDAPADPNFVAGRRRQPFLKKRVVGVHWQTA